MSAKLCCECDRPCKGTKVCHECCDDMCAACSRALYGVCTACVLAERLDFEEESFITADDAFGREG